MFGLGVSVFQNTVANGVCFFSCFCLDCMYSIDRLGTWFFAEVVHEKGASIGTLKGHLQLYGCTTTNTLHNVFILLSAIAHIRNSHERLKRTVLEKRSCVRGIRFAE